MTSGVFFARKMPIPVKDIAPPARRDVAVVDKKNLRSCFGLTLFVFLLFINTEASFIHNSRPSLNNRIDVKNDKNPRLTYELHESISVPKLEMPALFNDNVRKKRQISPRRQERYIRRKCFLGLSVQMNL